MRTSCPALGCGHAHSVLRLLPARRRLVIGSTLMWAMATPGGPALAQATNADAAVVRGPIGAALDTYLSRLEAFGFSGAVLAAKGDEVVLAKGYGAADQATGAPVTPSTLFYSASIAKQFTAAGVMILFDRGLLSPADSIGKFLPGVPPDKRPITLHHLLTHSSGLVEYFPGDDAELRARDAWVAALLRTSLRFEPGERVAYSNAGFSLLAAVVERVTGEPFRDFMMQEVLLPAGLTRTGFAGHASTANAAGIAMGIGGGIKDDPRDFPTGWGTLGSSGMLVSVEDLWIWERALRGGRVMSDRARQRMWHPHIPLAAGLPISYGYAWRVQRMPFAGEVIWASGIDQPFSGMYRRYVDHDVTLIFESNGALDTFVFRDMLFPGLNEGQLGLIVTGAPYTLPPWFLSTPPTALHRFAGSYELSSGGSIRVAAEDGALRITPLTQEAASLFLQWPSDSTTPSLASLTERVRKALEARGADTSSTLGFGPFSDEGITHPSPAPRLGRFLGADWLVTLPIQISGARRATTYGVLRFERGEFPMRWRWWGASSYGRDVGLPRGVLPPFRPQSETSFVSFHAGVGQSIHVRFDLDSRGQPTAMRISHAGGESIANRTGRTAARRFASDADDGADHPGVAVAGQDR